MAVDQFNQYFTNSTPAADDELKQIKVRLHGQDERLWTAEGVFSSAHLDLGTEQLLSQAPPPPAQGTFLDLGCGWGAITLSLALQSPQASIWAVDVNARALDLTARNAQKVGVENVRVFSEADALEAAQQNGTTFDLIWSNPPIRIGKTALHAMLTQWLDLLSPQGKAHLVVQKNLGADSLATWLTQQGWPTVRYASKKGFRVLEVSRDQAPAAGENRTETGCVNTM